jgi:hypothetical protein
MLRRITACAVLLALFSAYLTPLAAKAAPAAKSKKNAKPASKLAPDFITDAVMDALDAAAEFKGIAHFGETDFDMDGLAMLLFATRSFDLRHSPEGLAFHVSAVLNNPKVPTQMYNALAENVSDLISAPVADSALTIALYLRAREAKEEAKVA